MQPRHFKNIVIDGQDRFLPESSEAITNPQDLLQQMQQGHLYGEVCRNRIQHQLHFWSPRRRILVASNLVENLVDLARQWEIKLKPEVFALCRKGES